MKPGAPTRTKLYGTRAAVDPVSRPLMKKLRGKSAFSQVSLDFILYLCTLAFDVLYRELKCNFKNRAMLALWKLIANR